MLCEKSRAHNLEWYEIVALARFCLTAPAHDWDGESDDKVSDSESEFNGCTDQSVSDTMSFWEEVDNHLGCLSSLCKAHPAVAIPILMQLAGDERIDLFRRAALSSSKHRLQVALKSTKGLPQVDFITCLADDDETVNVDAVISQPIARLCKGHVLKARCHRSWDQQNGVADAAFWNVDVGI